MCVQCANNPTKYPTKKVLEPNTHFLLHAQEKCVFTTEMSTGVYVFINYLPFTQNLWTLGCRLVDHYNYCHVLHLSSPFSVSSNDYYTQLRPLHLAVGKYISLSKRLGYANGSRHSQRMKAEKPHAERSFRFV